MFVLASMTFHIGERQSGYVDLRKFSCDKFQRRSICSGAGSRSVQHPPEIRRHLVQGLSVLDVLVDVPLKPEAVLGLEEDKPLSLIHI